MGLKTVRVYKNTGFNGIDIPGTPAVLEAATFVDYPDFYYLREDIDLPIIKIKDNYDNLKDVDYVRITDNYDGKNYYYFAVPHALAKGVTSIGLVLDALLTMGGAQNQTYTSGWMTRGHIPVADDVLFGNVAPELFHPSRPLVADVWEELGTTNTNDEPLDVVISNIDLYSLASFGDLKAEVIAGIVSGSIDPAMYLPYIRVAPVGTKFMIWNFGDGSGGAGDPYVFSLPNTAAYLKTRSDVAKGLSMLYSFGQLQLGASYQIPARWYSPVYDKDIQEGGLITYIGGWHEVIDMTQAPYIYDTSIKNKKCFALFRSAHILAMASGDEIIQPIAETAGVSEGKLRNCPRIRTWADPSSTGKPYAGFVDLHTGGGIATGIDHMYADSVKGAQWSNSQIVIEGASGSAWNSLDAAFARAAESRSMERQSLVNALGMKDVGERASLMVAATPEQTARDSASFLQSVGSAATSVFTPRAEKIPADIAQVTADYLAYQTADARLALQAGQLEREGKLLTQASELLTRQHNQVINESVMNEIRSNDVVAPRVSFSPEINLGLYGFNNFGYYETRLHQEDLHELDKYFQRYGYSGQHKPLTASVFTSRQYYNYIEASGISLKGTGFGLRVRERAIAQLNGGVRVWHVLPDASYYDLN